MTQPNQLIPINDYRSRARQVFEALDVSLTTRQDYQYRIGLFLDFIKQHSFNHNSFLEYKRYLGGRTDYSVSTKNKYLVSAKIFLQELNRTGLLPTNITQNVKSFSHSKKHKRDGVSDEEMRQLTAYLQQLPVSPKSARLKAIISLLALQGLRQIEVSRLDVKDLDLVSKTAMVQGKGQDDQESIHLHPETVKALQEYLQLNHVADGPLFASQSNASKNHRLTTRAIRKIVTTILHHIKIDKTIHGFRHYFTSTLLKTYKGDLLAVAEYTRHKSLEMLQVYNDNVRKQTDLPKFYNTFNYIRF